ncbi:hypothetical protein [Halorhabdus amylolytica]|uniref:hypothetical protein n=1 Tax=Halorhabdus amylolytica TaxID=2559573 RepID=UPI001B7D8CAA|nr:hypothetical protein [Halorhabdus amylolytica]
MTYVDVWPEGQLADALCTDLLDAVGVDYRAEPLPDGVRLTQPGQYCFCVNFTSDRVHVDGGEPIIGTTPVGAYDVLVTESDASSLEILLEGDSTQ